MRSPQGPAGALTRRGREHLAVVRADQPCRQPQPPRGAGHHQRERKWNALAAREDVRQQQRRKAVVDPLQGLEFEFRGAREDGLPPRTVATSRRGGRPEHSPGAARCGSFVPGRQCGRAGGALSRSRPLTAPCRWPPAAGCPRRHCNLFEEMGTQAQASEVQNPTRAARLISRVSNSSSCGRALTFSGVASEQRAAAGLCLHTRRELIQSRLAALDLLLRRPWEGQAAAWGAAPQKWYFKLFRRLSGWAFTSCSAQGIQRQLPSKHRTSEACGWEGLCGGRIWRLAKCKQTCSGSELGASSGSRAGCRLTAPVGRASAVRLHLDIPLLLLNFLLKQQAVQHVLVPQPVQQPRRSLRGFALQRRRR
jgi:hypothetical protein